MKEKLGVSDKRPLADFLPTLTIAAKNLATEMTNYNVEEKDLKGEGAITTDEFMRFLQSKGIQIPRELSWMPMEKWLLKNVRNLMKRQNKRSMITFNSRYH